MNYTDKAITTAAHDQLDFWEYSRVLTTVVGQAETPLTVGIFGPWGSGKTSLMRLVQESLKREKPEPITVWFNAWKYDQEEALWRALIIQVLAALRPQAKDKTPAERHPMAADSPETPPFTNEEQELIKELDDLEASLYRPVEREEVGGVTIDWDKLLKGSIMGLTHLSLSVLPGIGGVLDKMMEEAEKKISGDDLNTIFSAIQRERRKIYRDHIQSLEKFQQEFSKLVNKQAVEKERRLVVFIDDLDRCLPEKAIEVLEAIKLFLDVTGCLFFLGVDRGVIEQGIRVKYKGFLDAVNAAAGGLEQDRRIPITGDDYLEKIVQLPFHLLPLDEQRVADFIEQSGANLPQGCIEIFAAGLEANPRKVKRALNIFRLLHQLAGLRRAEFTLDGQPIELEAQLLAKVVVIQSRYRELYNDLVETPLLLPELEQLSTGDDSAAPVATPTQPHSPVTVEVRESQDVTLKLEPTVEISAPPTLLAKYRTLRQLRNLLRAGNLFFTGRPLAEVKLYLYLTTTTAESTAGAQPLDTTSRWWEQLLSNDPTKIRSAAAELRADSPETWADMVARLEALAGQPDASNRLAANTALAFSHDEMLTLLPDNGRGIKKFRINCYSMTNAWYKLFLDANDGHAAPEGWQERWYPTGQGGQPITGVSWNDAQAFCRWAGKRLPKATEWQVAVGQIVRGKSLREWVNAPDGSSPLVMPDSAPEAVEVKNPDLGFRVAE